MKEMLDGLAVGIASVVCLIILVAIFYLAPWWVPIFGCLYAAFIWACLRINNMIKTK